MRIFVWVAGIAIPAVVALLFFLPGVEVGPEMAEVLHKLPALNAAINGSAFLCLVASYRAIRNKTSYSTSVSTLWLALSALLVSYVSYHMTARPFAKKDGFAACTSSCYFAHLDVHYSCPWP